MFVHIFLNSALTSVIDMDRRKLWMNKRSLLFDFPIQILYVDIFPFVIVACGCLVSCQAHNPSSPPLRMHFCFLDDENK